MSLFQHLQLQPVEPMDDGSVSELDVGAYSNEDDTIDLSQDLDGAFLEESINKMFQDVHEE